MAWKWSEEQADVVASIRAVGDGYKVSAGEIPGVSGALNFVLSRGGKDIISWSGHKHSVFVVAGDALYYSDFAGGRSGCAVVAHDMRANKQLWRTDLWTIPVQGHSQYRNRVNIEHDGRHVAVYGNESLGRYLELLDPASGRIVGYRLIDVADSLVPTAE